MLAPLLTPRKGIWNSFVSKSEESYPSPTS
jgi:hypothetical protein